jgi:hypothetical protein
MSQEEVAELQSFFKIKSQLSPAPDLDKYIYVKGKGKVVPVLFLN